MFGTGVVVVVVNSPGTEEECHAVRASSKYVAQDPVRLCLFIKTFRRPVVVFFGVHLSGSVLMVEPLCVKYISWARAFVLVKNAKSVNIVSKIDIFFFIIRTLPLP